MPSKFFPNWDFWFEKKPSGNPVAEDNILTVGNLEVGHSEVGDLEENMLTVGNLEINIFKVDNFGRRHFDGRQFGS
jgi:hypothetical protein